MPEAGHHGSGRDPWATHLRSRVRRLIWRFGKPHPAPVFVLGHQKSGTTAIGALLAAHMGVPATLDLFYRLGDFSIEDKVFSGELPFAEFLSAHRRFFRNPVIKDPSFTFFDLELRKFFPSAAFLFVVRDPRDNIRSILNRLQISGTERELGAREVQDALDANPGWRSILEGRNPPIAGGSLVEILARRWRRSLAPLLERPSEFVQVRYEDFCAGKAETIGALCEALGREGWVDIGGMVDRQFQGKGDNSATWTTFFGAENLRTISSICEEQLALLGYPS